MIWTYHHVGETERPEQEESVMAYFKILFLNMLEGTITAIWTDGVPA
jgi:hypothetical protein